VAADAELAGQVALVTGGGRGIGAGIAAELADAGMRVAVAARSREQVDAVASEIGGIALAVDVSDRAAVEQMVAGVEQELGPIDVLVNDAGIASPGGSFAAKPVWEEDPADWWRVFEVNVLGAYLCCRAVLGGMVERRRGRIINVGSGAAYLPMAGGGGTAYGASKAALYRFGELLAGQVAEHGVAVFTISPGLVRTAMTDAFGDGAPWTPPELAPRLVRVLASGRADALAGRYIHAEHDDIEQLIERAQEIREQDLNAIRLRR
jgi:NAD(P)-dependent dehydrogenase (short-subunit alcohol dehydrogenase family)